jgi:predicted metal-dependent phosphoesterase TrpH
MIIDLHLHSTASDGTLAPAEVVARAAQAGVQVMALTDHDTMGGAEEAAPEAARHGIRYLLAVELNTDASGAEVDILGYFLETPPDWFQAMLAARHEARVQRAQAIVQRLAELELPVSYERVRELAQGVVTRPHVAQAMIEKGYVSTQREAYKRYIGFGAPAYVERDSLHPVTAMRNVQAAGGLAIVAHPGLVQEPAVVIELVEAGVDGLEAYYPFHTEQQREQYTSLAEEHGLAVSAGSDAHGPGRAKSEAIGVTVPDALWSSLQDALNKAVGRRTEDSPPDQPAGGGR